MYSVTEAFLQIRRISRGMKLKCLIQKLANPIRSEGAAVVGEEASFLALEPGSHYSMK